MLYIMTNSQVYAKLQAEIDATLREGQVISDSQARTLPYLQAVIKEGSRICPPATGILSKKVYGDDSMIFRPERWLEAEGEDLKKMEKSLGLIWGYGRYSCLGKHTAFLELNKIFFEVS
jgi:cytochrome P450